MKILKTLILLFFSLSILGCSSKNYYDLGNNIIKDSTANKNELEFITGIIVGGTIIGTGSILESIENSLESITKEDKKPKIKKTTSE